METVLIAIFVALLAGAVFSRIGWGYTAVGQWVDRLVGAWTAGPKNGDDEGNFGRPGDGGSDTGGTEPPVVER